MLASLPEQLTCQAQRWVARMPPPVSTLAADAALAKLWHVRRASHLASADSSPQLVAVPALRMRQKVLQLHVLQSTATLHALVGGCTGTRSRLPYTPAPWAVHSMPPMLPMP